MAAFSFNKLQKEKKFVYDFSTIKGNYVSLADLVERDGEGIIYQVKGVFTSDKSKFSDLAPIVAIEGTYVNLPDFQIDQVLDILNSEEAVAAINAGACGITVTPYTIKGIATGKNGKKKIVDEVHYKASWVDVNPFDFVDIEDDDSGNLD